LVSEGSEGIEKYVKFVDFLGYEWSTFGRDNILEWDLRGGSSRGVVIIFFDFFEVGGCQLGKSVVTGGAGVRGGHIDKVSGFSCG